MAEYKSDQHKTTFTVSDSLTVRQHLEWRNRLVMYLEQYPDYMIRFWVATRHLIETWESEWFDDPITFNMEESTSIGAASAIFWAVDCLNGHFSKLEELEKKQ